MIIVKLIALTIALIILVQRTLTSVRDNKTPARAETMEDSFLDSFMESHINGGYNPDDFEDAQAERDWDDREEEYDEDDEERDRDYLLERQELEDFEGLNGP